MNSIHLMRANTHDITSLVILSRLTFEQAFAKQNTKEDLEKYINENFSHTKLTEELTDAFNKFFIAFSGDEPLGYYKLRLKPHPDQPKNTKAVELERIYVLHQHQSKKVGAALMEHAINFARINNFDTVWLGVWERNEKAITFYKRWGFEIYGAHPFMLGNDPQTDVLMKKSLY
jgi:diamine N-acetyltransferase